MKTLAFMLAVVTLTAGCAMPATSVRSIDTRPSISIRNAGEKAELFVDGLRMGLAADYEEPNRLNLEPGTHQVSISEGATTILQQTIFIESEHKTIIVR